MEASEQASLRGRAAVLDMHTPAPTVLSSPAAKNPGPGFQSRFRGCEAVAAEHLSVPASPLACLVDYTVRRIICRSPRMPPPFLTIARYLEGVAGGLLTKRAFCWRFRSKLAPSVVTLDASFYVIEGGRRWRLTKAGEGEAV